MPSAREKLTRRFWRSFSTRSQRARLPVFEQSRYSSSGKAGTGFRANFRAWGTTDAKAGACPSFSHAARSVIGRPNPAGFAGSRAAISFTRAVSIPIAAGAGAVPKPRIRAARARRAALSRGLAFRFDTIFMQQCVPDRVRPFSVDPPVFHEFAFSSETDLLQEPARGGVAAVAPTGDPVQVQSFKAKAEQGFHGFLGEALALKTAVEADAECDQEALWIGETKAEITDKLAAVLD